MDPRALRAVLAANIRALARAKGRTLDQVADLGGVSRAQLYAVLAKRTAPSTDWLARVAAGLDAQPWELLRPRRARTD